MKSMFSTQVAKSVPFKNSTNSFAASNVQDAVEEALNVASSLARFTIVCTFNGTISNNQWLGLNEVLPGNQVPIRMPVKCKLREIAFSYAQANILGTPASGENVDGVFSLYKNGLTNPTNVVTSVTFTNQPGGKIVTGLNIDIASGDYIVGRWSDTGDNPADMSIIYYFEPVR